MAEVGCLKSGSFKNLEVDGTVISGKRNVYNKPKATAAKTFTTADSGTLVVLGSTQGQIQVFNLPTIATATDLGTYFDFIVTTSGNSAAAGSYTINTGGSASDLSGAPTAGYDDFIGVLKVLDTSLPAMPDDDVTNVIPASGEGALILAANTSNATVAIGTHFRVTAVKISTTGAGADVWFIEGTIATGDATSFATTALFTNP